MFYTLHGDCQRDAQLQAHLRGETISVYQTEWRHYVHTGKGWELPARSVKVKDFFPYSMVAPASSSL